LCDLSGLNSCEEALCSSGPSISHRTASRPMSDSAWPLQACTHCRWDGDRSRFHVKLGRKIRPAYRPVAAARTVSRPPRTESNDIGSNDGERTWADCIDPVASRSKATPVSCTNANIEQGSRSHSRSRLPRSHETDALGWSIPADAAAYAGGIALSSCDTAVTSWAGAKGFCSRMLLGTPWEVHASAAAPVI
jgi:hypothetical protein